MLTSHIIIMLIILHVPFASFHDTPYTIVLRVYFNFMLETNKQPFEKIPAENHLQAIPFLTNPDTPMWCYVPA
jgi:hypothetical protein